MQEQLLLALKFFAFLVNQQDRGDGLKGVGMQMNREPGP